MASAWPRTRAAMIGQARADVQAGAGQVTVDEAALAAWPLGTVVNGAESGPLPVPSSVRTLAGIIPYVLVLSSINHRFWALDGRGRFCRYTRDGQVGANAMFQAFGRHWGDIYSALSRARWDRRPVTVSDISDQFGPLPDAPERAAILNEILLGSALDAWTDRLLNQIAQGRPVTVADAADLADSFPLGFGDRYLKKAQFALSHIARHASAQGHRVACELTAFADYQIPSVLRALGLIHYAPSLAATVDQGVCVERESTEERAIRGASILAVEALAHHQQAAVIDVDQWLWLRRRQATAPFHRTLTSAY